MVHFGKHGNLEWLPGKALALSSTCYPEAILGPMPHFYPFIVNDPGEGAQAKRRTAAVILDHLTPPMTQADSHGSMAEIESQMDEYYEAAGMDRRAARHCWLTFWQRLNVRALPQIAALHQVMMRQKNY